MSSQSRPLLGRPLYSRLLRGYGDDLTHLGHLRSACLSDTRISQADYLKVANAIQKIEKILQKFARAEGRKGNS